MSGDTRLPEVICYSNKGSLFLNDEATMNTGVNYFLDLLPSYYKSKTLIELPKDTSNVHLRPLDPFAPYNPNESTNRLRVDFYSQIVDSIPVLIDVEWDQYEPFNDKMPIFDGRKAPAGCVPIAIAQIMSCFKVPEYIDIRYPYDWNIITGNENDIHYGWELSRLISDIGNGLNCTYTADATSTDMTVVPDFLNSIGYCCPTSITDYNTHEVVSSLRNGCPVLMTGTDSMSVSHHGWWIFSHDVVKLNAGHAWVVDGYKKRRFAKVVYDILKEKVISTTYNDSEYLHCNWGFGSDYNGYYEAGVFDYLRNTYNIPTDYSEGYFQYGLECINNIHPIENE